MLAFASLMPPLVSAELRLNIVTGAMRAAAATRRVLNAEAPAALAGRGRPWAWLAQPMTASFASLVGSMIRVRLPM